MRSSRLQKEKKADAVNSTASDELTDLQIVEEVWKVVGDNFLGAFVGSIAPRGPNFTGTSSSLRPLKGRGVRYDQEHPANVGRPVLEVR